ncbi:MAG: 50S ribosomal protein L29 [Chloroflexi bacterium]|nr:50S ribosomal protein L29 [Chloroflexota bacterium]
MPNAADIREMTENEIQQALMEAKAELFNLRFQLEIGQLQNPARIKVVRRNIARYKTILRERQIALQMVEKEEEE